jgi:hypothetical protein
MCLKCYVVGWNSIFSVLKNKTLISPTCSSTTALGEFFSASCVPGVNKSHNFPSSLEALCESSKLAHLNCIMQCNTIYNNMPMLFFITCGSILFVLN